MITASNLPFLLQLLDDDDVATQEALKKQFAESSGDISYELAATKTTLTESTRSKLANLLLTGRRETLLKEWQVPKNGADAISGDWANFEHHLRLISDYLHDGVSIRPSLPDALDNLATQAKIELCQTFELHSSEDIEPNMLRQWLFIERKFGGNVKNYYHPKNSDLCSVIRNQEGNPISLATLFMLLGERLGIDISGCNFPEHFLARATIDGESRLIDCFNGGKIVTVADLENAQKDLSVTAKMAILQDAPLGHILCRILINIERSFQQMNSPSQARLFAQLADGMISAVERDFKKS